MRNCTSEVRAARARNGDRGIPAKGAQHADHPPIAFNSNAILDGIRRWVEIETPTEAPEQVNKLATWSRTAIATCRLRSSGSRDIPAAAIISWCDRPGASTSREILVLSHLDTVHPIGFIERLPFRVRGRRRLRSRHLRHEGRRLPRLSCVQAALRASGERPPLGVTQLYVSDEEIGSPTSRALIEAEGRKAKYVLVTEPARDGGKIVTGRKGVCAVRYRHQRAYRPIPARRPREDGRSAIRELRRCSSRPSMP